MSRMFAAALLVVSLSASALLGQTSLSLTNYQASPGVTLMIPVVYTSETGAALAPTNSPGRTAQAFALKINIDPSGMVTQAALRRAGSAALRPPLFERAMSVRGNPVLLMHFKENNGLRPRAAGETIAELVLTISPTAVGKIHLTLDNDINEVTNQAGTISVTRRAQTLQLNNAIVDVIPGAPTRALPYTAPTTVAPPVVPRERIGREVLATIAKKGTANVIVRLSEPVASNAPNDTRKTAIAAQRAQVLGKLGIPANKLRHAYPFTSALPLTIDADLLQRITGDPAVDYIGMDANVEFSLCDSISLTRANVAHQMIPRRDGGPGLYFRFLSRICG